MARLLFIGGVLDGQHIDVPPGINDWRGTIPPKPPTSPDDGRRPVRNIEYQQYTRQLITLTPGDNPYHCFVRYGLTPNGVLALLFENYKPKGHHE